MSDRAQHKVATQVAKDVEAFLARGGVIKQLPVGDSGNKLESIASIRKGVLTPVLKPKEVQDGGETK